MSQAKCFNCEKYLYTTKPMEYFIKEKFPVFCGEKCANEFPNEGTEEFKRRLKELI